MLSGAELTQEEKMTVGTVKFFNATKGYGFIAPEGGGKDVFVHATAVEAAGMRTLTEGQKIAFDIQPDARGAKAVNLRPA
jgi:CspA family cold shock protein